MINLTLNKYRRFRKCGDVLFLLFFAAMLMTGSPANAQKSAQRPSPPVYEGRTGHLMYTPDDRGNRVPDFSYCGYRASEQSIPDVTVKVVVPVKSGDATLRIQSAIDYVSSLPLDNHGFRGAVLLQKGVYEVAGQLKIGASGVVLRGSGMKNGTIILGTGKNRETLIRIIGKNDRSTGKETAIADAYVPVNANRFSVANAGGFKAGDHILIHRPSTKKWIAELGTASFGGGISALGWKPGERDIFWERTVLAVENNSITIDVPLTTALDSAYGGASVASCQWPGRITNTGVENLSCQSTYDRQNLKDEEHRWMAITMENVRDGWVRQVVFEHFAGSAVDLLETASRITVEDCKSLAPVSEIGGQRRNSFMTSGQQTLFQRCYAEKGYHDFAVGFCAPGPNAFVQCHSARPYSFSGTISSWASGVLFDIVNVDGQALRFGNRGQDGQGAGWSAANSVFWQCTAARVDCYKPPTANNWAFGTWAQFSGDGYWGESNNAVEPRSLYYAQLQERLKKDVSDQAKILYISTSASSSPTVDVAAQLTALAYKPATTLSQWIDSAVERNPIPVDASGAVTIDKIGIKKPASVSKGQPLHIQHGWLLRGNKVVVGRRLEVQWWNGSVFPADLPKMRPHITRFVPGRTGTGLTDDLDEMTDEMKKDHTVAIEHNYGLWYDRRRDDHERIRRMDGEVWPPFYELPFERTGRDTAWDGLSKYDLTKYNHWYWSRLKQFADLADQKGLVLMHQNYFQHNIIEAGAHYADFPWRTVNNINHTGFPEPPGYAGDKRIFFGEQFYDITQPVRRGLHTAYIRKCLDNFKDNTSVIQLIGAEFTGPSHFVKFWLDVIGEWEKEKNKREIIGLSVTKDVQDAILADQKRAALISLIDIRYWHYQADGSAYAPKGGQNLAPRQHARLLKPKKTSFEQVYRAVREYRDKYPGKAVVYSGDNYQAFGWAAFMAGGSLAQLPVISDVRFWTDASTMHPLDQEDPHQWILGNHQQEYIIYNKSGDTKLNLAHATGIYTVHWIDPVDGKMIKEEKINAGKTVTIERYKSGDVVIWVTHN